MQGINVEHRIIFTDILHVYVIVSVVSTWKVELQNDHIYQKVKCD